MRWANSAVKQLESALQIKQVRKAEYKRLLLLQVEEVSLLGILPLVGGIVLAGSGSTVLGAILIAVGILILILITVSLIASALNSIILAALYIYAAEDQMPEGFDSNLVRGAFAAK